MKDASSRPLSEYTDMVVDSDGEQDVATTMSLLEGFLLLVHKRFPHIKKIVLISDNGRFWITCLAHSSYCFTYAACRLALCLHDDAAAHGSF